MKTKTIEIDFNSARDAQIDEETEYSDPRSRHWYAVPVRGTDKKMRARIEMIDEGSTYAGETIRIHELFRSATLKIIDEEAVYGDEETTSWIKTMLRNGREFEVAGYRIKWI